VNHSTGDFDEIDVVSHFRGNLHAPTVFPNSIRVKILCVLIARSEWGYPKLERIEHPNDR
jgi:hypothetical protein